MKYMLAVYKSHRRFDTRRHRLDSEDVAQLLEDMGLLCGAQECEDRTAMRNNLVLSWRKDDSS